MLSNVLLGFSFSLNIFVTLACAATLIFMLGRLSAKNASHDPSES
jgi:hypothetical protein